MNYKQTQGGKVEARTIETLKSNGYQIVEPTREEDTHQDIDVWLEGEPVSIKAPTYKSVRKFGRVSLEYRVQFRDRHWEDSWFLTGQAHAYLFVLGDEIYWADKLKFREFMRAYESDKNIVKWRCLKQDTKDKQYRMGHPHIDSVTANVRIDSLKQSGVFEYIGKLGGSLYEVPNSKQARRDD